MAYTLALYGVHSLMRLHEQRLCLAQCGFSLAWLPLCIGACCEALVSSLFLSVSRSVCLSKCFLCLALIQSLLYLPLSHSLSYYLALNSA